MKEKAKIERELMMENLKADYLKTQKEFEAHQEIKTNERIKTAMQDCKLGIRAIICSETCTELADAVRERDELRLKVNTLTKANAEFRTVNNNHTTQIKRLTKSISEQSNLIATTQAELKRCRQDNAALHAELGHFAQERIHCTRELTRLVNRNQQLELHNEALEDAMDACNALRNTRPRY